MTQKPDARLWQGRLDSEDGPTALRWHQMMKPVPDEPQSGVALLGYPCDLGVAANHGRIGAAEGPDIIRKTLASQPWHHSGMVCDAGNIVWQGELESAQSSLAEQVCNLLRHQLSPLVLGGGHDVAWGSYQGLRRYLDQHAACQPKLGVLNFDAHFDLRSDSHGASSGTPFYQIARDCEARQIPFHYAVIGVSRHSNTQALFERADHWQVNWVGDQDSGVHQLDYLSNRLAGYLDQVDALYLTIDMDAFPATSAPGVSAPAPRGISVEVVEHLLNLVAASGKPVLLAEIAEFNPTFDIDSHTARLAARLSAILAQLLADSRQQPQFPVPLKPSAAATGL